MPISILPKPVTKNFLCYCLHLIKKICNDKIFTFYLKKQSLSSLIP